jgi:type III restriction enzyme
MKAHVDEFNEGRHGLYIRLVDLRTYPEIKRSGALGARGPKLVVFYYRSDNLNDEHKERIVDFGTTTNGGRWYVLLDEAHKGDKEDSKRQHIYSILSRNGFLFNFSATFTDSRDIVTTVYDFNLARFVEEGYGKHIAILRQENRAFRDQEDYTGVEKQRVVLKALLMLAYVRQTFEYLSQYGRFLPPPSFISPGQLGQCSGCGPETLFPRTGAYRSGSDRYCRMGTGAGGTVG